MIRNYLFVALGGALGSMLRYSFTLLGVVLHLQGVVSTFAANIVGSFIMGFVLANFSTGEAYLFAGIGLCGGFTTFSTFSAQTLDYFQMGNYPAAIGYALASVLCCVAFVALGMYVGKLFN